MSTGEVYLLGAVAGLTIFLGLPMGRMGNLTLRARAFLNAVAVGILVFLFYDILKNVNDPVSRAMKNAQAHTGSWGRFVGLAGVALLALAIGMLVLVHYDAWMDGRRHRKFGPGAASVEEFKISGFGRLSDARRLAVYIAVGIGLHNFGEGLAIGQSAAKGEISLAVLLIIGFGLHNATEGFGIIGPMAAAHEIPSWGLLGILGLIGGGPTLLGTIIGHMWVNDAVFVGFLALAAGSILYVVIQLVGVALKLGNREVFMWGLLGGLVLGLATDYVLIAAGL
jgi:zinc transporter, ZIP family